MNSKDNTYNGWPNYETWLVALHLDNEQVSYHDCQRMAIEAADEAQHYTSKDEASRHMLAIALQTYVEGLQPEYLKGVYADLITHALGSVDWRSLAEHYLEKLSDVKQTR